MRLSRIALAASVSLRDASRSFFEHVARRAIELLLELIDLAGELVLAVAELLRFVRRGRALRVELLTSS